MEKEKLSIQAQSVLDRLHNMKMVSDEEIAEIPEVKELAQQAKEQKENIIQQIKETGAICVPGEEDKVCTADYPDELKRERASKALDTLSKHTSARFNGKKYEYDAPVNSDKKLYLVIGPPSAGKSSCCVDRLSQELGARIVDCDEAKKCLEPEFNHGAGADLVHAESNEIIREHLKKSIENDENIMLPKLGHSFDKGLMDFLKPAIEKGYKINVCFVDIPHEHALERLISRTINDRRYINPGNVHKCYDGSESKVQATYETLKEQGFVNGYAHISNDVAFGQDPVIIEAHNFEGINALNPEWAKEQSQQRSDVLMEKIQDLTGYLTEEVAIHPFGNGRDIEKQTIIDKINEIKQEAHELNLLKQTDIDVTNNIIKDVISGEIAGSNSVRVDIFNEIKDDDGVLGLEGLDYRQAPSTDGGPEL